MENSKKFTLNLNCKTVKNPCPHLFKYCNVPICFPCHCSQAGRCLQILLQSADNTDLSFTTAAEIGLHIKNWINVSQWCTSPGQWFSRWCQDALCNPKRVSKVCVFSLLWYLGWLSKTWHIAYVSMYVQQAYLDACLHDGNSQWMHHLCNFSCGFVLVGASQKAPASWFSEQKFVRYVMISYMEKGNEKFQILKTDVPCKTVNLTKKQGKARFYWLLSLLQGVIFATYALLQQIHNLLKNTCWDYHSFR